MRYILIFAAISFYLSGCGGPRENNLDPTALIIKPSVNIAKSPHFAPQKYKTAFVAPPSEITKKQEYDNAIIEQNMSFRLGAALETCGYRLVNDAKDADIIGMIRGSNKYDTYYVPPSTVILPKYIPGQTYTTNSDYSVYGSRSPLPYATVSGQSTTTTSGQWTSESYTRPGYTAGNYYPSIRIDIVDAHSGEELHVATATGTSGTSDIRVASQVLILESFEQVPPAAAITISQSAIGIIMHIGTVNGNDYYPFCYRVAKGGPADRAGLKFGDCVLEIDGKPTLNGQISEIIALVGGEIGTTVNLEIYRSGQRITKSIKRESRDVVFAKDK